MIAVAAEVVLPVASVIASQSVANAGEILDLIWGLLASLDDVAASVAALLPLASALYAVPAVATARPFANGAERRILLLLPLLRHGVVSVRGAGMPFWAF